MFGMAEREALVDRVAGLVAARDRLDAELARAIAEADEAGAWTACPHRGSRRFLRHHSRQSSTSVRAVLIRARLVGLFPETGRALSDGRVGVGAVDAIAAEVTAAREVHYRRDESVLLGYAAELDLEAFEALLAHWASLADDTVDPGTGEWRQHLAVQQRFDGGADIFGALDELTAQTLLAALDAFDPGPDPLADPGRRSLRERRADSLGDVAAAALHLPCDGDEARDDDSEASDSVTDENGTTSESRDTSRSSRTRRSRGHRSPVSDTTIVIDLFRLAGRSGSTDLDGLISRINGRTVSGRAVEALLCDSWISALIRDARGAVIDATERSAPFTATQRRLLAARDQGCVVPGCDRPPSFCDAHHITPRERGGPNTLENAALLCRRHHRLVHHGWRLHRDPDAGWTITSPTGRTWASDPPPAGSHLAHRSGPAPNTS